MALLAAHAVVHRFRQRLEDVANLKRNWNAHRLVQPRHTHKPVGVLLIGRSVFVSFVILHHCGVQQGYPGHHATAHQHFLLNLQFVAKRQLTTHRLVHHVQTLNLRVEERYQCVGYVDAGRRAALVKVHRLQRHQRSFHLGKPLLNVAVVLCTAGQCIRLHAHSLELAQRLHPPRLAAANVAQNLGYIFGRASELLPTSDAPLLQHTLCGRPDLEQSANDRHKVSASHDWCGQ